MGGTESAGNLTASDNGLAEIFRAEAEEHLAALRDGLGALSGGGDTAATLTELHRRAHTLKGAAATVGRDDVADAARAVERAFRDAQRGARAVDADAMGTAIDSIAGMLGAPVGAPQAEPGSAAPGTTAIKVLIADDSPTFRAALGALIESDSTLALVGVASDADEAADLAEAECPDVAIVDVRMPAGGGEWALQAITQRSPETRVIAMSGDEDERLRESLLSAGAVAYVVKGGRTAEILDTVRAAVTSGTG